MTNQAYQLCKFMKEGFLISFIFLLIILWLSSCSDLQKESSNSACNAALDNQDFDTAISVCTSSKGKGDAYMGKGGFTITNLLSNSGGETTPSHISGANTSIRPQRAGDRVLGCIRPAGRCWSTRLGSASRTFAEC